MLLMVGSRSGFIWVMAASFVADGVVERCRALHFSLQLYSPSTCLIPFDTPLAELYSSTSLYSSTVLLRGLENCLFWQAASFSNIDIENEPKSSLVFLKFEKTPK